MISLSKEQEKYVLENFKGSIVINETRYYFKPCKTAQGDYTGIENVIERLAKIVGINCAEYDLILLDNTYYEFSKLIDPYFYLASDRNVSEHATLYDIWNNLFDQVSNIEDVMKEVIKIYIFDLLIMNYDRHCENWGLVLNGDAPSKVYIFDNEHAFDKTFPIIISSEMDYPEALSQTNSGYYKGKPLKYNYRDLKCFFETAGYEFIDLLIDMYKKLTPEVVDEVIEDVKKTYGVDLANLNFVSNYYRRNYRKVGELIEDYKYMSSGGRK